MPGLPGLLGVAAFGGIKFVGYAVGAFALKKLEPTISARAMTIGAVRTGFGIVLGPLATILIVFLVSMVVVHPDVKPGSYQDRLLDLPEIYALLFVIRIFVWAAVLFLFTRRSPLSRGKFWLYSLSGAIVSCLLDWPGYALAIAAPGRISIC